MPEDCLFCKIVNGDIPAEKVYEDEHALAFKDINPAAPVHILVIPKKHLSSVAHAEISDQSLLGKLLLTANRVAKEQGLEKGFRYIINTGEQGGQTVFHLHLHILGGRPLVWPPG